MYACACLSTSSVLLKIKKQQQFTKLDAKKNLRKSSLTRHMNRKKTKLNIRKLKSLIEIFGDGAIL